MANTYQLIQSTVLGSDQPTVDFSNIPNIYDDLLLYVGLRSTKTVVGTTAFVRFNNDSGSTQYEYKQIYGYSGGAGGYQNAGYSAMFSQCGGASSASNTYNAGWYYIPQYRGSYYKSMIGNCGYPNQTGNDWQNDVWAFTWKSTAVINSLNFSMDGGNMASGSVLSLYGIKYTA